MILADLLDFARSLWPAWLILVFLAIVFHAFRPRNRRRFDDFANIPFREDRPE